MGGSSLSLRPTLRGIPCQTYIVTNSSYAVFDIRFHLRAVTLYKQIAVPPVCRRSISPKLLRWQLPLARRYINRIVTASFLVTWWPTQSEFSPPPDWIYPNNRYFVYIDVGCVMFKNNRCLDNRTFFANRRHGVV